VSCFRNIPCLACQDCSAIIDVSALGNAIELDLSECKNIQDVSALGRVHTLKLSFCEKITDPSALEWVHSLEFEEFQGTTLSGLKNIVNLDITNSPRFSDLTMLRTVPKLNIPK
jgi:hypothetical protein